MKSVLVILALLVSGSAFAGDNGRDECVQGQNEVRFGKAMTCYSGRWIPANVVILKCKEGSQQGFPVHGVYNGREELVQTATCKNGKWLFANPAYNYKPTKGLNRCKNGSSWVNGDLRNWQAAEHYTCVNGKAVRVK